MVGQGWRMAHWRVIYWYGYSLIPSSMSSPICLSGLQKRALWVTLKHSSDKSKVKRNKMKTAGEKIEFKCLIRATDGKKTISTMVGPKDHQRFQSSYATILKARMTALKKRERKDKRKTADSDKKQDLKKQSKPS
ncbi:hypothetical protein SASPL_131426 [Salvia splendens]|uniref:Signal recognition particle 14 kDa protein n=1 Tax=Salvia splendens TaxID=180675 RepID=A0A8X8X7R2_SALSN|nr:hypothetical protein SASPL_131426 [Salvia splendens]